MKAYRHLISEKGQMTVELCAVFPVVIVIAAILFNALVFFGNCAAFDRISRNEIRVYASSISDPTSNVTSKIADSVKEKIGEGSVECESDGDVHSGGYVTFSLTYEYLPTLFGMDIRSDIFGVSLPAIRHTTKLTVDTYSPGKWLLTCVQ